MLDIGCVRRDRTLICTTRPRNTGDARRSSPPVRDSATPSVQPPARGVEHDMLHGLVVHPEHQVAEDRPATQPSRARSSACLPVRSVPSRWRAPRSLDPPGETRSSGSSGSPPGRRSSRPGPDSDAPHIFQRATHDRRPLTGPASEIGEQVLPAPSASSRTAHPEPRRRPCRQARRHARHGPDRSWESAPPFRYVGLARVVPRACPDREVPNSPGRCARRSSSRRSSSHA